MDYYKQHALHHNDLLALDVIRWALGDAHNLHDYICHKKYHFDETCCWVEALETITLIGYWSEIMFLILILICIKQNQMILIFCIKPF